MDRCGCVRWRVYVCGERGERGEREREMDCEPKKRVRMDTNDQTRPDQTRPDKTTYKCSLTRSRKDLQMSFKPSGWALVGKNNVRQPVLECSAPHIRVHGQQLVTTVFGHATQTVQR